MFSNNTISMVYKHYHEHGLVIINISLLLPLGHLVDERFAKRLSGWKGNMLSIGDMVTLANACLSSIALYMLSFLEAPKKIY
jgi:hypothetical protein